jgi:hypothetical protein
MEELDLMGDLDINSGFEDAFLGIEKYRMENEYFGYGDDT